MFICAILEEHQFRIAPVCNYSLFDIFLFSSSFCPVPTTWYSDLDARRDNPAAFSSTSQGAASGSRGPSIQSTFTTTGPVQARSRFDATAFQGRGEAPPTMHPGRPTSANDAGLLRALARSPAMDIRNILNPQSERAHRAASEPGQIGGQGLGTQINAPGARSETGAAVHHVQRNIEQPPESPRDSSSDDQAPFADGPQYNIPPLHYFRDEDHNPEGRGGEYHSENRVRRQLSNSSFHHQAQPLRVHQPTMPSQGLFDLPPLGQSMSGHQRYRAPEDVRFHQLQQTVDPDQRQGFVSQDQFNALQQSITHGFQSMAALLVAQRPTSLAHRRTRNRPSQNFSPMPPKLYGLPEHRPPEDNELHDAIRKHFDKLLGADPLKVTVTMAESQAYSAEHLRLHSEGRPSRPSTTAQDFRIDIAGLPRGPWNKSAVDVFIPHFAQSRSEIIQVNSDRWITIREQALNRIQSLKAAYVEKQRGVQYSSNIKKSRRGAQRKEKVCIFHTFILSVTESLLQRFHRRLKGAIHFNVAQVHINMLRRFGPAGMSSDESDWYTPDEGPSSERCPRYYIHRPQWRNHQVVTFWLRIFDSLYQMYGNSKTDRRGARV